MTVEYFNDTNGTRVYNYALFTLGTILCWWYKSEKRAQVSPQVFAQVSAFIPMSCRVLLSWWLAGEKRSQVFAQVFVQISTFRPTSICAIFEQGNINT